MIRRPPRSTRTDTLFPYTTLFRSDPLSEHFLGALRKGIARIVLPADHGRALVEYIAMPEDDLPQNRFNDGAIDRFGNIWAGSMDDEEQQAAGNWWHIDAAGTAKRSDERCDRKAWDSTGDSRWSQEM